MGITQLSLDRINRYIKPNSKILIIGCQNCYWPENYGEVAQDYFRSLGHTVKSIDVYECNGADVMDLRNQLNFEPIYDLVLQHGTVEHVDGELYMPFLNMHMACKEGGIMIHENPKVGNWPGHGYHYFTPGFYTALASHCGYEVLELCEEPAMSNVTDGWNVSCVLKKGLERPFLFMEYNEFKKLYDEHIRSK